MARLHNRIGMLGALGMLTLALAACSGPGSHQATMEECRDMNAAMAQGRQMTAEQQRLHATCAHMDHSMTSGSGRSR